MPCKQQVRAPSLTFSILDISRIFLEEMHSVLNLGTNKQTIYVKLFLWITFSSSLFLEIWSRDITNANRSEDIINELFRTISRETSQNGSSKANIYNAAYRNNKEVNYIKVVFMKKIDLDTSFLQKYICAIQMIVFFYWSRTQKSAETFI